MDIIFDMYTLTNGTYCNDIFPLSNTYTPIDTHNKLAYLTINVRSLRYKIPNLITYLSLLSINFSFIILTEVWLDENLDTGFILDNYNSMQCFRNANGGGILIFYKKGINVVKVSQHTGLFGTHEALLIRAHISQLGDIFLWSFYRPPDRSLRSFISYLENELPKFCGKRLILCGDFNYDINSVDKSSVIKDLCNLLESFGFRTCVNKPTHFSETNRTLTTCLDHYWQNFVLDNVYSYVVHPPFSDHLGTVLVLNLSCHDNDIKTIKFRNFSLTNKRNFSRSIEGLCSNFHLLSNDINVEVARFIAWMTTVTGKYFPLKTKHVSDKRLGAPWLTRSIMKCIRKKHTWYKLFMAGLITYGSYRDYCRLVQRLLRAAERSYYETKFRNMGHDSRNNWKIINKLISSNKKCPNTEFTIDGQSTCDKSLIANKFHNFFETIPQTIGASLPQSRINGLAHINRQISSFFLPNSSPQDVLSIVKSLKNNKNEDGLLIKLLKLGDIHLSTIISKLINLAISSGIYPNALKIAKITPIYKSGNSSVVENYRPISVLCNLNKIFEKYLYNKLTKYFTSFGLFSDSQFGFRSGFSTESAMLTLVSAVLPAFQDQSFALGVFLDFSKAFDTVNHEILLAKLYRYGVRGLSLSLIKSYLTDRMQCVNFLGTLSDLRSINIGVPQGSCLGPLFYSIYVNDFHTFMTFNSFQDATDILYADDTTVILTSPDINYIQNRCQSMLNSIWEWCLFNRLSLNAEKSTAIIFSNRVFPAFPIQINNRNITFSNKVKYLGVIFESDLKFKAHFEKIYSSTCKYNGLSFRLSGYFTLTSARCFYYAFFFSSATYCISIWGGMLLTTTAGVKLCKLQKRIILNLFSKFSPNLSFSGLVKKYEILKIEDVYRLRTACLMYNLLNSNNNPFLFNYLNLQQASHTYATRSSHLYIEPFPRVSSIRINFKYQFINIWNNIPVHIKSLTSNSRFKSSYKAYLLSQY